ncbi:cation:proton antiporter [Methylobacterium sp. P31]
MYQTVAVLFAFVFAYSLVAAPLERSPIAGALLFTTFGLAVGPAGLNIITPNAQAQILQRLAEFTLALVLFTDAANADLGVLRHSYAIPGRLLLIGLPLTILLGFLVGALVLPELGLLGCALLATMLAPTDAALGKAVVTNAAIPGPVREGLNVESGLNDGICVPVLLIFLALAAESDPGRHALDLAFHHFATEIGVGLCVGVGLAVLGVPALRFAGNHGWIDSAWRQLPAVALALTAFAAAQALGGSGFIGSFVGGLVAGGMARQRVVKHELLLAAEGAGNVLALLTWVLFGAVVIAQVPQRLTWAVVVYAVLSLTAIRMVPVWLALAGTTLATDGKLFIGWFGPRGLASVVFAVIVLAADLPGSRTLTTTVAVTIILSILAHGLTANPLSAAFARRATTADAGQAGKTPSAAPEAGPGMNAASHQERQAVSADQAGRI